MFKMESMFENLESKTKAEEFDFDKRINFDDETIGVEHLDNMDGSELNFDNRIIESNEEWQDFNFADLFDTNEVLEFFEPETYEQLFDDEKAFVIDMLKEKLVEELQLENPPEIVFADLEDDATKGSYAPELNAIVINTNILQDGGQVRNTMAHEMRHAWQHERAEQPEEMQTTFDKALKENFDNYVSPEDNYRAYRSQLVEMDAREFASGLVEEMYRSQT